MKYYKVIGAIRGSRFISPDGKYSEGQGFVGKVTMKFNPMKFFTLKQKDGLQIDARADIIEESTEFDFETAVQLKLTTEVDNG